MKTGNRSFQAISLLFVLFLASACAPAAASGSDSVGAANLAEEDPTATNTTYPVPALETVAPVGSSLGGSYQSVSPEVCQILQEAASLSLGLMFNIEEGMPFIDPLTGETGWSCTLLAETNGAFISDPNDALSRLVAGFVGWEEQSAYAAGGPTGAATAMTRDSGLILISVGWEPSADISCPADQPITDCPMAPEKKLYTIKVEAVQK